MEAYDFIYANFFKNEGGKKHNKAGSNFYSHISIKIGSCYRSHFHIIIPIFAIFLFICLFGFLLLLFLLSC